MKNFARALRMALEHKWTVIGAFFCSLMVAVMWGANITTVYPFIEVVFRGDSMQSWIDERIVKSQESLADYEQQLQQHQSSETQDEATKQKSQLAAGVIASRADIERKSLAYYQWLQPYIHQYLPHDPFQTLVWVVVFLLVGTLLKDLFLVGQQILVARLTGLVTLELRQKFYRHVLRMDLGTFGKDRTGTLMSHFTSELGQVVGAVSVLFGDLTREPLKMVVCVAGAAFINWRLLLFSFVLTPIALYLMNRLAKRIKVSIHKSLQEVAVFYNRLSETFTGIQVIKAFNTERLERRRFRQATKQLYRRQMQATFLGALAKPNTEILGIGVICLALLSGGYLVLYQETSLWGIPLASQKMTFGSLMAFFAFLAGVSDPARKFSAVFGELQRGTVASDRLFAMLDRQPAVQDPTEAKPMPEKHAELIFDKVQFHYLPEQPVLHEVSLRIPFGQSVAIVGPNGCGKSTLASLIMRFYDPVSGTVRLDYTDLRHVRQRDLRAICGMVTQQPHLFDDTIMENIRYGSLHASNEQVIAAAKQAHAHKFIEEVLEDGYHTNVGERGGRLSGGQRQRIALARAILRNPQILILDEATSQIDPESEALIHKALEQFIRGRTTIMITHRLSTLALADRIIVMDQGRIIADGRHHELLERCDTYRRLHQSDLRESA